MPTFFCAIVLGSGTRVHCSYCNSSQKQSWVNRAPLHLHSKKTLLLVLFSPRLEWVFLLVCSLAIDAGWVQKRSLYSPTNQSQLQQGCDFVSQLCSLKRKQCLCYIDAVVAKQSPLIFSIRFEARHAGSAEQCTHLLANLHIWEFE